MDLIPNNVPVSEQHEIKKKLLEIIDTELLKMYKGEHITWSNTQLIDVIENNFGISCGVLNDNNGMFRLTKFKVVNPSKYTWLCLKYK